MKYSKTSLFFFALALLFCIYRFWGYPNKLIVEKGFLDRCSFINEKDGRGGTNYKYFIYLENDSNSYKIPAKFLDKFKLVEFKSEIKMGDYIEFLIDNGLNYDSYTIYQINTKTKIYLNSKDSNKIDQLEKNVAIPLFISFFIFIGLLNQIKYKNQNK